MRRAGALFFCSAVRKEITPEGAGEKFGFHLWKNLVAQKCQEGFYLN